jgi:hypothetical protein
MLNRFECEAAEGQWLGSTADCVDEPCVLGACCLDDGSCIDVVAYECAVEGGAFYPGIDCASNPCDVCEIVSASPPNCAIDARQNSEPDGSVPGGWAALEITFSCSGPSLAPEDFTVELAPGGETAPVITAVDPTADPNTVALTLDGSIPTSQWTCFTHNASGTQTCLGYLPADVNSDRTSSAVDILAVIDNLNGQIDPPFELWQCDSDRSDVCGPSDILRVIDLLNGADEYEIWLNRSLGPCPGAP